jgi:hypothetical protein
MTINIYASLNKEIFLFSIRGRDIYFNNRQFKQEIRCIPKDTDFERRIILSRNRFPPILKEMFNLPEKDKKEYEEIAPLGEKALADKSVEDLKKHGLLIIKVEEV